jgi:hypothetical protein
MRLLIQRLSCRLKVLELLAVALQMQGDVAAVKILDLQLE